MESLLRVDQWLLLGFNGLAGNVFWDSIMIFLSEKWVWIPFYAFILFIFIRRFGWKKTAWICFAAGCMIVISDQGSVQLFKEIFQRPRPCHLSGLKENLNVVAGKCGGAFGFISSHAANVFSLAFFVLILIRGVSKWFYIIIVWAMLVSISRVYLGVHYPSDVVAGMFFGMVVGINTGKIVLNVIESK